MHDLFLHAPRAMLLIDPIANQILQVNHEACQLFGIKEQALSDYSVTQFFSHSLDKLTHFTQQVFEQRAFD